MCAIVTLIDFKLPVQLWRDSKRDLFTWISCFAVCVFFGVEVGLFFGIAITAAHLLFLWARPEITVRLEEVNDNKNINSVQSVESAPYLCKKCQGMNIF